MTGIEVLEALKRVVERHGADTLYAERDAWFEESQTCRYADDETGAPMCIVGALLAEEYEIDLHLLIEDGVNEDGVNEALVVLSGEGLEFDDDAQRVLEAAQMRQDRKSTWGYAYEYAAKRLNNEPVEEG